MSDAEHSKRVEHAAHLVGRGLPLTTVARELNKEYGAAPEEASALIAQGRELLVKWHGQGHEQHAIEAAAFYRSMLQDPGASAGDRLRAWERLDSLLGLDAPAAVPPAGVDKLKRLLDRRSTS